MVEVCEQEQARMTEIIYGKPCDRAEEPLVSEWWRTVDKWSLAAVIFLFLIGILLGMAASPPLAESNQQPSFYYVKKQSFFGLVALSLMLLVSMASLQIVRRVSLIGFLFTFVLLALLPIFGTDFGKGAVRWFSIYSVSLQPSEFLKPCFVVFSAWAMSGSFDENGPPGRSISFFVMCLIAFMLAIQPDFGQATLIVGAWSVVYFISGAPLIMLVFVILLSSFLAAMAYFNSAHVASRINGFLSPDVDPLTQLGYATNAIQKGGFLGVGIGDGSVKWNLPDAHTDFIIAVAAEEYGLILCLIIIAIYFFIIFRSLVRLLREGNSFIRLSGAGVVSLLAMQALINLGVAVRLLPAKGMTLPFVSYGGSSVVAMGFLMGVLLAFTRRRPRSDLQDILRQGGRIE